MKLLEATIEEYRRAFPRPAVVYNSAAFTELNSAKVDRVCRIIISADSGSPLLGLTFGEKEGALRAPFSAPFACFDFNREHGAALMLEAAALLRERFAGAVLTLPPLIYAPSMISKMQLSLLAAGANFRSMEWNYHLDLTRPFEGNMTSAARNKLRQAERLALRLEVCELQRAYEVIRRNRENRGYDLAMSLEQVEATVGKGGPVKGDFFVMTDGVIDVAAAIIYRVTSDVAQVIYWGDDCCPNAVNLLARELAAFYAAKGLRYLDVGPSGADGLPNLGLSDFKDSIGCITTPKPVLTL